jgi:Tol biopolymer transport system component
MIGRILDNYRLDALLGEGGMGIVYRAHDLRLDRTVAVKLLPPERVADPDAKQRFIFEARAASALNHPGIVTIHDIRAVEGVDFIVMEYIQGTTLADLIPPGGMATGQVLRCAALIADALAAAHKAAILHRDLKPGNVMVTRDERVKILDFGLAKLLRPIAPSASAATVGLPLTADHTRLGTAAYMSPEQAEGRTVDARSDIFSFGIVLYEMATGRRPFIGESSLGILANILNEDPAPPAALNASIHPELERIILRCLRKEPARRFQTAADLKASLDDLQSQPAAVSRHPPAVRAPLGWRAGAAAVLALILAAAIIAAVMLTRPDVVVPLRAEPFTTLTGPELYPSLSPDGRHVAFTWTGPKGTDVDIYVQQIGAGQPLPLTRDPRTDYNPVWSPDGRWIAFLRGDSARPLSRADRELRLIAPLGGPERKLADIRVQEITINPVFLTWCPDSACLIVTDSLGEGRPDALFTVPLDGSPRRQLTEPPAAALADTDPAISSDGRSLLFLRRLSWAFGELHVLPLRGDMTAAGAPRAIDVGGLKPDNASWVPGGKEILFSSGASSEGAALWRMALTGTKPPERLPFVGENGIQPTLSPPRAGQPARLVYVRSQMDENIWRVEASAMGTPPATPPAVTIASTKADIHPQFSPDAARVAFTSTRSGSWEIWTSDVDGANAAQLTTLAAPTGTGVPRWSPDGRSIVFASDAEGQFDIFVMPSSGGKPRNITSHAAFDHVPAFSRDGQWIYFSSTRSGRYEVWKVPVAGGAPLQVTTDGGWLSQESADGVTLYFSAAPTLGGAAPLFRMPAAGGPAVKVVDGVVNASFAVVNRGVYFAEERSGQARLQFYDFSLSQAVTMVEAIGDSAWLAGLCASADGRMVLYGKLDAAIHDLVLVENFR